MTSVISSTSFSNLLFEAAGDATANANVTMGVGAKVLRTFVLGSECSRERKFRTIELSAPGSESSCYPYLLTLIFAKDIWQDYRIGTTPVLTNVLLIH